MRALITTTIATIAAAPVSAFAAGGHADDSGIFVWVFLGFCAMIVVAQVVPAVLLMTGIVKGVASVVKEEMATSKAKN
jgi:heme exporter protein D